jgi:hypothetical protein
VIPVAAKKIAAKGHKNRKVKSSVMADERFNVQRSIAAPSRRGVAFRRTQDRHWLLDLLGDRQIY